MDRWNDAKKRRKSRPREAFGHDALTRAVLPRPPACFMKGRRGSTNCNAKGQDVMAQEQTKRTRAGYKTNWVPCMRCPFACTAWWRKA